MADERRYYIGTGPEAAALAERAASELQRAWDARRAFCSRWEADSLAVAGDGIRGLAFMKKQEDKPWLRLLEQIDGWYVYGGNRRMAKGKTLTEEINAPEMKMDACDRIASELNLCRMILSGRRLLKTVLWVKTDGRVLVSIPSAPIPAGWQGDPYPDVPAWLHEVGEAEWNQAWNEGDDGNA